MFAFRFFRPTYRTVTRNFNTITRTQPLVSFKRTYHLLPRSSVKGPNVEWQNVYRRAQTRQYRQAYNYRRFQRSEDLFKRWAARPTFYYEVGGIGVVCGGYYLYNLEPVPVSGRMRFNVVSPQIEKQLGEGMFQETMQEFGSKIMPEYSKEHRMVQRVLDRLIPHSGLQNEAWEIRVINDATQNAFVIPGGKVFVFRGILDMCEGDDGLAAVLGHEIAHNVAHHAAERVSQSFILVPLGLLIFFFVQIDLGIVRFVSNLAFTLPGSRKQEREADYIGLLMMAESCYDPSTALGLWSRMEQEEKYAPPQFLSTHPSNHDRLEKIRGWLAEAETKRENSDCQGMTGYADDFRRTFEFPRR